MRRYPRAVGWLQAAASSWLLLMGAPIVGCAPQPPAAQLRLPPLPALEDLEEPVRQQFRQRYEVAEGLLAAESENDAALSNALGNLGMVYQAYQDLASARLCYRQASQLDPKEFRWLYLLGFVERQLGDHVASDAALEAALVLRPGDLPSMVWRAENAFDQGRLEDAGKRFQAALETSPECVRARYGLARVSLESGEPERALADLKLAHAKQPQAAPILYALGLTHRALGDLEQAAVYLEQMPDSHLVRRGIAFDDPLVRQVQALERGAMVHEHRGLKAAAQGRYGVAAAELREAVTLDTGRLEARHNLALALLRLGRRQEARQEIDAILERAPDFVPTHILLAGLWREEGRLDLAEQHLRRAVALDPDSPQAQLALADLVAASNGETEDRE